MSTRAVSNRAQRFVIVGVLFLVAWSIVTLLDVPRRTTSTLAIYGFVLHVIFGKAYALVPAYFDRQLAVPLAPALQLPLTAGGTVLLAIGGAGAGTPDVTALGAVAWAIGAAVFLVAIGWTVRDNLTGTETGTGQANAHRRRIDRAANAVFPVVLAYLAVGAYDTAIAAVGGPTILAATPSAATHLLAAGVGALMVFTVGFRLLPRLLVADPIPALVAVVLPAGAVAPALLAADLGGGTTFRIGAAVQSVAVVGFATAYAHLLWRSDRDRVGFYGVLAGVIAGVAGVAIGVHLAFAGLDATLIEAHWRLNALGFLGLTIVGVAYCFYPPAIGSFPGANDRTALASIGAIATGLALDTGGLIAGIETAGVAGRLLVVVGVLTVAYLVFGLFWERR